MNKILNLAVCLIIAVSFSSCREEIKTCSGRINGLSDSTMVAVVGGDEVTFDILHVRYDNGVVMPGDSVSIYYVGRFSSEAHALLVHLVPSQGNVVTIDTASEESSNELKTREDGTAE